MEDQGNIPVIKNNSGQAAVWVVVIILLIAAAVGVWFWRSAEIDDLNEELTEKNQTISQLESEQTEEAAGATFTSEEGMEIQVFIPQENATVASPVVILGQVPGNWSFEASFPVELRNSDGDVIAEGPAELQGEWMTEALVPFIAVLELDSPPEGNGTLVLMKANASGLPENDDQVSISVNF